MRGSRGSLWIIAIVFGVLAVIAGLWFVGGGVSADRRDGRTHGCTHSAGRAGGRPPNPARCFG